MVSKGLVLIAGEISCDGYVDLQKVVRDAVRDVGYTNGTSGMDADHCTVLINLNEQSPDIAQGVSRTFDPRSGDDFDQIGAGDQGLMFGYATSETSELMPMPIMLAHKLTRQLAKLRKNHTLPYLKPDGKAQVTVAYDGDNPVSVTTVVISTQHHPDTDQETLKKDITEQIIRAVIPAEYLKKETTFFINPTGRFVRGGPEADVGLTGRKIIVDIYGGVASHGGGAFSGKDPTKVDRSASYYARYIAKNLVASGLAKRCQVQLAYVIGVVRPVCIYVDTFSTSPFSNKVLSQMVSKLFDARPAAIIEQFELRRPIYKLLSAYGHFGRDEFPWEQTNMTQRLRSQLVREELLVTRS